MSSDDGYAEASSSQTINHACQWHPSRSRGLTLCFGHRIPLTEMAGMLPVACSANWHPFYRKLLANRCSKRHASSEVYAANSVQTDASRPDTSHRKRI